MEILEVEKRKAESKAKYEKLAATREVEKAKNKAASDWLTSKEAYLFYNLDIGILSDFNTLSMAAIVEEESSDTVLVTAAYTLKNPNDDFNKKKARLLLADRLQSIAADYRFVVSVPKKAVNTKKKLLKLLRIEFRKEIFIFPEIMPQWIKKIL
jgi:hypothetical protein